MEVHVVTAQNEHLYPKLLKQFFEERHKIYAEELEWVPLSPDKQERDVFDTDSAVYFLGVEDDVVIAGSRLTPTIEPHLLSEVFPHLCTKGIVRDERVAEWTRGFVSRAAREGTNKRILFQFCFAIMEYAVLEGLTQIGGIQRTYWLNMWKMMRWSVHIHGEPAFFNDDPWVPAYFDVSEEALEGAKRLARVDHSLLVRVGDQKPFIETPTHQETLAGAV